MKAAWTCAVLLACASGAFAARPGAQQVVFPPPPAGTPPSTFSPVPIPSPPPAAVSFQTPGLDWSVNVVVPAAFFISGTGVNAALQATLCQSILAAANTSYANAATPTCTVAGQAVLTAASSTASGLVTVSGYIIFQFTATPTPANLVLAVAERDTLAAALASPVASLAIFASTGLVVRPNCACDGLAAVTDFASSGLAYLNVTPALLGPAQCDARLTYNSTAVATLLVGIDNGSVVTANKGKFCSSSAISNSATGIVGGVAGVPGTGSCNIYGVSTGSGNDPANSSTSGQLCADATQVISGVTTVTVAGGPSTATGAACAPLGIDSFLTTVCSTPAATGGVLGVLNAGTCNVLSSFIPQPNGTASAASCLSLKQTFVTTVTASAPVPPSPVAPACTYSGNYRMEAVGRAACGVEFPSYYGGSPSNQTLCSTQSIQLRTEKQLPKLDRATFELTSTGEIKTVRRGCAAGEAVWTPEGEKLRLLTTTTPNWKIEASAGDCNLVAIKSTFTGTAAPYVSSPSPSGTQGCKSRQLFMTDKIYDTGRQLFRLRKF